MARSHHRISGAPPGPPFYLCLCLSPVSGVGSKPCLDGQTNGQTKRLRANRQGLPPSAASPRRAGRPFHPGVHEPWKTY